MNLNQYMKRYTTWLLLFSFLCAMQLSAMPISETREDIKTTVGTAAEDPSPSAFEQVETPEERYGIKKTPWGLILGISAAVAIGALLIFVVFKKSYDITGKWTVRIEIDDSEESWTYQANFSGDQKSGNTVWTTNEGVEDKGTYSVLGKKVEIDLDSEGLSVYFEGKFKNDNLIKGTWETYVGTTGVWTANRETQSTTTIKKNPDGSPFRKH